MGTTPESLVGVMLVPRSVRPEVAVKCVSKMSPTIDYGVVKYAKDMEGNMRILIVCAIMVTTAIGLGGCLFHWHQQAVVTQPLK